MVLPATMTRCGEVSCCISCPGANSYSPDRFGGLRSPASLVHRVNVLYGTCRLVSLASSCWTRTTLPRARSKASSSLAAICDPPAGRAVAPRSPARKIRRTVLRESFSSRLISRRLSPCAFKVCTLLRISLGIIFFPLDVVAEGLEAGLQPKHGAH
jgi:hypothetical protein